MLGPALFAASLAWSGFTAQRTVLDPARSEQIAVDLYDDPDVRGQLVTNASTALSGVLPEGVDASGDQLDAAATRLLDDARVRTLLVGTLTQAHRSFLGESENPLSVDLGVVGVAARDALVGIRPDLASTIPDVPAVVIDLPTDRIPNASPVRSFVDRAVPVLTVVAIIGVALAFFTTSHRPSVLKRAGWWAITSALFVVVLSFGLPFVLRQLLPDQAEVLSAILAALLAAMTTPSLVLAGCGVALVVAAMVWNTSNRLAPAGAADQPVGRVTGAIDMAPHRAEPEPDRFPSWNTTPTPEAVWRNPQTPAPEPAPVPVSQTPPTPPRPVPAAPAPAGAAPAAAQPPRAPVAPSPAGTSFIDADATSPIPTTAGAHASPTPAVEQATALIATGDEHTQLLQPGMTEAPRPGSLSEPGPPPPRWREGIGWVQHPDDPREHPGAQWQPGIGYVLPGPVDAHPTPTTDQPTPRG